MTENTLATNKGGQSKPTASEQAIDQVPQDQANLPDLRPQMSRENTSTNRANSARKPLFRS